MRIPINFTLASVGAAVLIALVSTGVSGCHLLDCQSCNAEKAGLDETAKAKALEVLRAGLRSDDFWPSIHAAEGLTLGGYGEEVKAYLEPQLARQGDDQKRCGLARELVRAGDRAKAQIMLGILAGADDYGHVHAAESLYKVGEIGDGVAMRAAFEQTDDERLRLMAAAALAKQGDRAALGVIRDALNSEDSNTRRISGWLLGRLGTYPDRQRLSAALAQERASAEADPVVVATMENSLAVLGDPAGKAALRRNLDSTDGPTRTYAATFAGDAGMTDVTPQLIRQLDDGHEDARIRAAQTLLVFAAH